MFAIRLPHLVADDRIVTAPKTGRELQVKGGVVDLIDLDGHNLLQLFHLLLHLHGLRGLVSESLDKVLHLSDFLLLVLIGAELLLATLLSQDDVLVVFHLVICHTPAGDFHRAVRHIVDESTVVTHQHHRRRRSGQKLLQPLDGLDVEMVGRLVQQQHVGLLKQDLGQFDTHTPTARELLRGALEVRPHEAQAHQRALQFGLAALRPHHQQAFVLGGIALHKCHIVGALVVGALAQLALQPLHPRLHVSNARKGLLGLFPHRGVVL